MELHFFQLAMTSSRRRKWKTQ